jgi:hypothetical protein
MKKMARVFAKTHALARVSAALGSAYRMVE